MVIFRGFGRASAAGFFFFSFSFFLAGFLAFFKFFELRKTSALRLRLAPIEDSLRFRNLDRRIFPRRPHRPGWLGLGFCFDLQRLVLYFRGTWFATIGSGRRNSWLCGGFWAGFDALVD